MATGEFTDKVKILIKAGDGGDGMNSFKAYKGKPACGPAGGDGGGPAIRGQPRLPRRCRIVPPGRDSDLEAFSHNPTDGSFAPLAPQPSTYTKCLNLRFLSY